MILLFNKIPVTLKRKIQIIVSLAQQALGSEFFNVSGSRWLGDKLTVKSLFPKWIIKKSEDDPSNVLIVEIIKSYQRWLFDVNRGYGAAVPWETIRDSQQIPDKLLLGIADLYFPSEDFSSAPLVNVLPNIRKFAINSHKNYFHKKGSLESIKYLLITLLDMPYDNCEVVTGSPGFIIVRANVPDEYKDFLNRSVYPAGMIVLYESP
jgi:hypothetical protein